MPFYQFRCPAHGLQTLRLSMEEAGRVRYCTEADPIPDPPHHRYCNERLARVWTVPAMIMRPGGYNLKPGDRGYAHFRREVELGEIDAHRPLVAEDEADPYVPDPALVPEPSEDAKQALGEWAQANLS